MGAMQELVEEILADAPPLSPRQVSRIKALFRQLTPEEVAEVAKQIQKPKPKPKPRDQEIDRRSPSGKPHAN